MANKRNPALTELSTHSRSRRAELQRHSLRIFSGELHLESMYFLATVDFRSSLFNAPLTNLPESFLFPDGPEAQRLILDEIRNVYPLALSPPGLVAALRRHFSVGAAQFNLFFFGVDAAGALTSVVTGPGGPGVEIPTELRGFPSLNRSILALVNQIRSATLYAEPQSYLIFRLDRSVEYARVQSRSAELGQVGFLFSEGTVIAEHVWSEIATACSVSSFATINLLEERERYFEKALRQAIRGRIIKYGEGKEIAAEVAALQKLQDHAATPDILEFDRELEDAERKRTAELQPTLAFSWYTMPRYTLGSLLDLLTSTSGLQPFEIRSIVRSGIAHLHQNYWGEVHDREVDIRRTLGATLAIALDAVEQAQVLIKTRYADVRQRRPVKFERGIDVFAPGRIRGSGKVFRNFVTETRDENIALSWADSGWLGTTYELVPPVLREISSAVARLNGEAKARSLIAGTTLHGDCHFGNLLVDASVPEDPLIISIDPKPITAFDWIRPGVEKILGSDTREFEFKETLGLLPHDLAYDAAKLILSSSCGYGLAYRYAFTLTGRRTGTDGVWHLKWVGAEAYTKLNDVGGISGAQIVKVDGPVPETAWDYHRVASEVVLDEFFRLHREALPSDHRRAFNLWLVRTWILTIRHAFSICGKLFPMDVERAASLYLIATVFVNHGKAAVLRALEDLDSPNAERELRSAFTVVGSEISSDAGGV